jgi:hypothetical protein
MKNTAGKLSAMDLRKYFEQKSDEIRFVDAHKNLIMTHGCSTVNWRYYKGFLPENVYIKIHGVLGFRRSPIIPIVS